MEASEAVGRFVTTEELFSQLVKSLNLAPNDPLPYFEALVRREKSAAQDGRSISLRIAF